jgi:hypothetical protein
MFLLTAPDQQFINAGLFAPMIGGAVSKRIGASADRVALPLIVLGSIVVLWGEWTLSIVNYFKLQASVVLE